MAVMVMVVVIAPTTCVWIHFEDPRNISFSFGTFAISIIALRINMRQS